MRTTMQSGGLVAQNEKQEAVAKKAEKPKSVKDLIEIRMPEIQKVLPSVISPQQFLRLTLNAIQSTPHLMECTMPSFYGAVMQCAQLGLKPNVNGEAYLIPFKNNKKGGCHPTVALLLPAPWGVIRSAYPVNAAGRQLESATYSCARSAP